MPRKAPARRNKRPTAPRGRPIGPMNIPTVQCNPKRRYTLMFNDQEIETPPAPKSGTITYGQLYNALYMQINAHKNPPFNIVTAPSFGMWRNIRLVSAAAWGVPFSVNNNTGVKFSLILNKDAMLPPSVEKFDQAAGASDRPFAMVRGSYLHWSTDAEKSRAVLTYTDVDVMTVVVEVW
jgi:hypothetical protein